MAKIVKDGFIIYKSFYAAIEGLTDAEIGRLFRLIFKYQTDGTCPAKTNPLYAYFMFFKAKFDADSIKYDEVCEKREAAARARWNDTKNK